MIKNVSINELENVYDVTDPLVRNSLEILLSSIDDWPNTQINSLDDFNLELCHYLNMDVTKKSIEEKLSNIDFSRDAWKAEALSNLLEIFSLDFENKSLTEIIEEVENALERRKH